MNIIEAIKQIKEKKANKIRRKSWKIDHYAYLWLTDTNCIVSSVGHGHSCPPLMESDDYIADDWEKVT